MVCVIQIAKMISITWRGASPYIHTLCVHFVGDFGLVNPEGGQVNLIIISHCELTFWHVEQDHAVFFTNLS